MAILVEEQITFPTSRGFKLSGELIAKNSYPQDLVVFAHGTGSNKASKRNRYVAEALVEKGIASFLFDFTGHGESDGIIEQSTQDQQLDDLLSALDYISEQNIIPARYIGINGSSTGATVALQAASQDPRIQVLVARVPRSYNILQYVSEIDIPTLILQGSEDKIVLPEALEIFNVLNCTKKFHLIDGAGHLFDEKYEHTQEMIDSSCNWFCKWFSALADEE